MKLNDLGHIYSSGNSFTTKAALLQSVYRVNKGFPIGETTVSIPDGLDENGKPKKKKKIRREYGHMVKGGDKMWYNFYNKDILNYAQKRVAEKLPEETIEADRLFNNLLSSMPLAFNLFYPLMELLEKDVVKTTEIVAALFPNWDITKVDKIGIEFIPTPIKDYTEDKSAMDAFITFIDKEGEKNIIAIEVKYTDSLGTNKAKENEKKYEVAKNTKFFTAEGLKVIDQGCTQIFRNFLLTESYRMKEKMPNSYNVILAPAQHPSTLTELNAIKKYFNDTCPEDKLTKYDLETFVHIIAEKVPAEMKDWINWFEKRYLDFGSEESLYKELKG